MATDSNVHSPEEEEEEEEVKLSSPSTHRAP
jgi:hypothetical protein